MIKAYSQRLMPPYSGQVQIAESDRARALTMDGENWEIHFCYASNVGVSADGQGAQRLNLAADVVRASRAFSPAARGL